MAEAFQSMLEQLLAQVIHLEHADKGNIQIFEPAANRLKIVAQIGFDASFLQHFLYVKPFDPSTCGRAFGVNTTVLISDIETDIGYKINRGVARQAGYRAVKSVPVFSKTGECIGIVSTHFKEPKWNWETAKINEVMSEVATQLQIASGVLQHE